MTTFGAILSDTSGSETQFLRGDGVFAEISGSDVISVASGSVVKHAVSGITAGSYNALEINVLGHATGGSVISYLQDVVISGSDVMSDTSGCIVKHNISGIPSGSYNIIEVNTLGHAISGSVASYLTDTVISGSDVMSNTSGCVVKHNASGVSSGSYSKLYVDNVGHVTTGCEITLDEIGGRSTVSQNVTIYAEDVSQGQAYELNFTGTGVTATVTSGSAEITFTAGSGGGSSGSGGHTIQDDGTPLAAQDNLDFYGAGVTAYDYATGSSTRVEVDFNIHSNEIVAGRGVTVPAGSTSVVGGAIVVSGSLILNGSMVVI